MQKWDTGIGEVRDHQTQVLHSVFVAWAVSSCLLLNLTCSWRKRWLAFASRSARAKAFSQTGTQLSAASETRRADKMGARLEMATRRYDALQKRHALEIEVSTSVIHLMHFLVLSNLPFT